MSLVCFIISAHLKSCWLTWSALLYRLLRGEAKMKGDNENRTCVYCGRVGTDLIQMGRESDGKNRYTSYICNGGCPDTIYVPSWSAYFAGTLVYDWPFFLLGVLMITAIHFSWGPSLSVLNDGGALVKIFAYGTFVLFPIAIMIITGLPIILSPIALSIFSWWMIYG